MTIDDKLTYATLLELRDAAKARESFLHFYARMTGFDPQPHHRVLCHLLQRMEEDRVDRAMIMLPPRMGKSIIASQLFPAWIAGRHPKAFIMSGVHTQTFADRTGGKVRNLVRHRDYPFQTQLAPDSQAKSTWATTDGGEYNGFGLMGGSTHGNPAEWLIMDDLIKGRKMALSEHMREEAWETYQADLLTRLQGRRKQIMIGTRWHEDDVAGRILPDGFSGRSGWYADRETAEPWYVLCIPAKAEHDNDPAGRTVGEWLWPDAFGEDAWGGLEKRGGYLWSALYQQRPSPEEGLLFSAEHISHRHSITTPQHPEMTAMQVYLSSDYAVTSEAGSNDPDWTVHMVWGVDPEFRIYLLEIWRERTTSDVWIDAWLDMARRWKPLRAFEENGQIIKSVGPFIRRRMLEEQVFVNRVQITSSVSKEQRAHGLLGLMSEGRVFLPRREGCRFLDALTAFERELLSFPAGRHDDTVDAATLFGRAVDMIVEGSKPQRAKQVSPHGYSLDDLYQWHDEEQQRKKGR